MFRLDDLVAGKTAGPCWASGPLRTSRTRACRTLGTGLARRSLSTRLAGWTLSARLACRSLSAGLSRRARRPRLALLIPRHGILVEMATRPGAHNSDCSIRLRVTAMNDVAAAADRVRDPHRAESTDSYQADHNPRTLHHFGAHEPPPFVIYEVEPAAVRQHIASCQAPHSERHPLSRLSTPSHRKRERFSRNQGFP